MDNLIVRCSELYKLMTKSRSKTDPLSETTKAYLMEKAKESHYGIRPELTNKYLEKGINNEDKAIQMLNDVRFMDWRKNGERITTSWLTGECDINGDDRIIDIKNSWSFETFPCFEEEAQKAVKKSGYDWQLRGYMLLYNKNKGEVCYCLTQTPTELLTPWDDIKLHNVDHIDPSDRITSVIIERDKEIEKEIKKQYEVANAYFKERLAELQNKNKKQLQWI